ncbi:hypothetical protein QAD02_019332 [Eretmocerus hayati]|uniref:Uncharacterized protein n=1 Tax=Eretmocerus hayati TaxID=131215 RepID=A0ACC2PJE7_9HYME|nr:hypothetical protein QAD02_019332 [Eretmocerus hayati]
MLTLIARRIHRISSNHQLRSFTSQVVLETPNKGSPETTIFVQKIIQSYFCDIVREDEKKLFAPVNYISDLPQHNIIKKFLFGLNYWMKLPSDRLQFLEDITYMTYLAFTMTDDGTDNSELRKSFPTAQQIYGHNRTWLAANALVISAIYKLAESENPKAVQALCKNMIRLYGGLSKREEKKDNISCPSSKMYMESILGETGSYVFSVFDVMQSYSECKKDFTTLAALVGLYFQIQNDNRNFSRDQAYNDKIFAEDITCGTYNYPIILAAETNSLQAEIVLNIVRNRTRNPVIKNYCIDLVKKLGAMKTSLEMETELYKQILCEIENLGGNPEFKDCIEVLHEWKIEEIYPDHPEYENF